MKACIPFMIFASSAASLAAESPSAPLKKLTVTDEIQMRTLENASIGSTEEPLSFSPDGGRYVLRVAQDDISNNRTCVDFLTGRTTSLRDAKPLLIDRLCTSGGIDRNVGSVPPTHPDYTGVKWIDNDRFVFLWGDAKGVNQLMMGDSRTHSVEQLTHHETAVIQFAILGGKNGSPLRILYMVYPEGTRAQFAREIAQGFAVDSSDAVNTILAGQSTTGDPWDQSVPMLFDPATKTSTQLGCDFRECKSYNLADNARNASPSGQYLVVPTVGSDGTQLEWAIEKVDPATRRISQVWRKRGSFSSRFAPIWAPTGDRVIIGPVAADESDAARSYVEVDASTLHVSRLPIENAGSDDPKSVVRSVGWRPDGVLELDRGGSLIAFQKLDGEWRPLAQPPAPEKPAKVSANVRVSISQGLNSPPMLVGFDSKSNRTALLLDIEPRLREYTLGRVKEVALRDREGTLWEGRLFYPVGYRAGTRYPMVITMSSAPESSSTFSLIGSFPTLGPLYAAQALANRGIAVLSLSDQGREGHPAGLDGFASTAREGEKVTKGFEAAVDHFVQLGIADPEKIGLAGFSRTGSYVQQAITRSSYRFAAAVASDSVNLGYLQAVIMGQQTGDFAAVNGGRPFGAGLQKWLANAPPFNADKVRTPLRIESLTGGTGGLILNWEMFAQLRALNKPVELLLSPLSDKAIHPVQMPVQKRFSQEGTVDWMDFWLNGREDPNPEKKQQYERWERMRRLVPLRTQSSQN